MAKDQHSSATEVTIEEEEEDGEFNPSQFESPENSNHSPSQINSDDETGATPIGEVIKLSGETMSIKSHYKAFEFDGFQFYLGDIVLLSPDDEEGRKPSVAIIKEITQKRGKSLVVLGQRLFRPQEAEKEGGGGWVARNNRELYYSSQLDEVPATSVMHRCQVHFLPFNKQFPDPSVHPGFFVQKIYDTRTQKLQRINNKCNKQHELDILLRKTRQSLGETPDLEGKD
ncbi:hypothetical protein ACHQM5_002700 [Ranunculus cassubicifolius]